MMSEDEKWEEAMKSYEDSANYFDSENDATNANKRLEKMAFMASKLRKYEKAIPVFEKIAKNNVDNNLLRWNVKNHLFRASICVINQQILEKDGKFWNDVTNTFDKYNNISDLFANSREAKMVGSIIEGLKTLNEKLFKDAINEFDSISPLDAWTTEQLLIMEKWIKDEKHKAPDLDFDNDSKHDSKKPNIDQGWNDNDNNNEDNNNNNNNDTYTGQSEEQQQKPPKEEAPTYDIHKPPAYDNAPDLDQEM
jgi:tetratricopeptide (TPR) repeat protein